MSVGEVVDKRVLNVVVFVDVVPYVALLLLRGRFFIVPSQPFRVRCCHYIFSPCRVHSVGDPLHELALGKRRTLSKEANICLTLRLQVENHGVDVRQFCVGCALLRIPANLQNPPTEQHAILNEARDLSNKVRVSDVSVKDLLLGQGEGVRIAAAGVSAGRLHLGRHQGTSGGLQDREGQVHRSLHHFAFGQCLGDRERGLDAFVFPGMALVQRQDAVKGWLLLRGELRFIDLELRPDRQDVDLFEVRLLRLVWRLVRCFFWSGNC